MNQLWWFALPILLLPIWWHRRKREQHKAELLATSRSCRAPSRARRANGVGKTSCCCWCAA